MKCCVQRIHKSEAKSGFLPRSQRQQTQISLKTFLEMLAPLLYRNQSVFMEVFRENIQIVRPADSSTMMVALKDISSSAQNGDDDGETSARVQSALPSARTHTSSDRPVGATVVTVGSHGIVQAVVDNLLVLIFQQWTRFRLAQLTSSDTQVVGCNQKACPSAAILDVSAYLTNLSIADLLVIVADLISSVPGLATCIHKFNLTSSMERLPPSCHGVLRYCLEDMTHAVTGESLQSSDFVTFVVHYLLMSASLFAADTDMGSIRTPSVEGVRGDCTGNGEEDIYITGKNFGDAPAYLLATLLARPGDGRRRCLKEIVNAFKLQHHLLDTTSKLRAISVLASTVHDYNTPKASWRRSEMLVFPAKDIHSLMGAMKLNNVLSEALCAVSLEHPLALDVSLALAVPLDAMIRRKAHDNSNRVANQVGGDTDVGLRATDSPSSSRAVLADVVSLENIEVVPELENCVEAPVVLPEIHDQSVSSHHADNETDTFRHLNDSLPIEDHSIEYTTSANQSFQDDFSSVHVMSDGEDDDVEHDDVNDEDDEDDEDDGDEMEEEEEEEEEEEGASPRGVLRELPEELRNIVTAVSDGWRDDDEEGDDDDRGREEGEGEGRVGERISRNDNNNDGDEDDDRGNDDGGESAMLDIENFVSANDEQISAISSGVEEDDDDAEDDYVMADPDAVEINWGLEDDGLEEAMPMDTRK